MKRWVFACIASALSLMVLGQGETLSESTFSPLPSMKPTEKPTFQSFIGTLGTHTRLIAYDLRDQTDDHDELVFTREWLLSSIEGEFALAANVLALEDVLTGEGAAFLRLAPLPHARVSTEPDFRLLKSDKTRQFEIVSNGYAYVVAPYVGGKLGRIQSLHAAQRQIRPYKEGRDGVFLSNTWGGGFRDAHVNETFLLKEISAAAEIGVEVVEIDDGWQKGRSMNSVLSNGKGVWNGYWAADPQFWEPDPVRFPNGFTPLITAAKASGLKLGLWYGPDSSNDAANWRKDLARLMAYYKEGIPYFKIDSMKSLSAKSLSRQRALFDALLAESRGEIVVDLDVTAEIRPGYFGLMGAGTIFVENRYPSRHRYWPHHTLRNLWSLAEVIDPVRLRMEVANPDSGAELYEDDPLAPATYRMDTLFASVMLSSPLGWFENSGLSAERKAQLSPLVSVWKTHRTALHTGWTFPVGARPDGVSWTGFVTKTADNAAIYVLFFRELNANEGYTFDLTPYLPAGYRLGEAELLGGRGTIKSSTAALRVEIPALRDFVWARLPLQK